MKILTNFQFEAYAPRSAYDGVEFVTFGPSGGRWIAGETYAPDLVFEPTTGSIDELLGMVPGSPPDIVLLFWPDQMAVPRGLERCPVRTVGVLSDYNLSLPWITDLWPFFDVLLTDRAGVDLFDRLGFADVRYWCQFSFQRAIHRPAPAVPRDLDLVFVGNLNPNIQRERLSWIHRLRALAHRGVNVHIASGAHGKAYAHLLQRAKLGFNRAIRGEMNMRAFEVPACGALLLQEDSNLEIRDYMEPGRDVALYADDATADFEEMVLALLADDARREEMARAGHEAIQRHAMPDRIRSLLDVLTHEGPGRPVANETDVAIGRATSMLSVTGGLPHALAEFLRLLDVAADDPRTTLGLASAAIKVDAAAHFDDAMNLVDSALLRSPGHVPALANKVWLLERAGCWPEAESARKRLGAALLHVERWDQLDGAVLPMDYSARTVSWSTALQAALRSGDPGAIAQERTIAAWT